MLQPHFIKQGATMARLIVGFFVKSVAQANLPILLHFTHS